jgi:hypothetical protein
MPGKRSVASSGARQLRSSSVLALTGAVDAWLVLIDQRNWVMPTAAAFVGTLAFSYRRVFWLIVAAAFVRYVTRDRKLSGKDFILLVREILRSGSD